MDDIFTGVVLLIWPIGILVVTVTSYIGKLIAGEEIQRKKKKKQKREEKYEFESLYDRIAVQVIKQSYAYFINDIHQDIDNKDIRRILFENSGDNINTMYLVTGNNIEYDCIVSVKIDKGKEIVNCRVYQYKHDLDMVMNEILISSKDLLNNLKEKWR